MEIKTKKRIAVKEIRIYIAVDGKEFETMSECVKYERRLKLNEKIELAERLRIRELDEKIPLDDEGEVNENNTFRWYEVKDINDFTVLNAAYQEQLKTPSVYPETICVETVGQEAYTDDAYNYNMEEIKEKTRDFWDQLGYKVSFHMYRRKHATAAESREDKKEWIWSRRKKE